MDLNLKEVWETYSHKKRLIDFIAESNKIEGIDRPSTKEEQIEAQRFLDLDEVMIKDLEQFVSVYQPDAVLRRKDGCDVYVGNHTPPAGGIAIAYKLHDILNDANLDASPFDIHVAYELLHPFSDGNGRSGRMLWLWKMNQLLGRLPKLSFLHSFYYQTLNGARD